MSLTSTTPISRNLWVPSDKSGLVRWFHTRSASNYTIDGSNRCSQWNDLSANAAHGVNATDAQKPVLNSNQLNGFPCLRFTSSSSQRLVHGTDNTFASGDDCTIVIVCKNTAGSGTWYQTPLSLRTATANRHWSAFFTNDTAYDDLTFSYVGATGSPVAGLCVTTSFAASAAAIIQYNGGTTTSTGSWTFHKNLASVTVNASGNGQGAGSINYIGAYGNTTASSFFNGDLFEIIVWNSVLTAGELFNLRVYLMTSWGL
jgi:hypothetical protein